MATNWWTPDEVDTSAPSPARVYDVHLGGAHNFAADRELAAQAARIMPELPALLQANRRFLIRTVRFLVAAGVTQFLDLGSGIPTVDNVHEVAQGADPRARVVYVDYDPVAAAHARLLLRDTAGVAVVQADLRDPDTVLADPAVATTLDLDQPVALLAVAVMHFVPDADDPAGLLHRYLEALAPSSCLALTHATAGDDHPQQTAAAAALYAARIPGFTLRSHEQIAGWLSGLQVLDPGVVFLNQWHPELPPEPPRSACSTLPAYGAVAYRRLPSTAG